MKVLCLILTTICIASFVHAQKDFHGEIIYKIHYKGEAEPDDELKVLFGDRKIKLLFNDKEKYNNVALLVFLDSGVTYSINVAEKMFNRKVLAVIKPLITTEKKSIAGYSTKSFQQESNVLGNLGRLMGASNARFYLADSLTYFVPEKYKGNTELAVIQQNKIVLGAEIQTLDPFTNEEDSAVSKREELLTVEAVSIKPMLIKEDEFIIPADYTDRRTISFQPPVIVDTTVAMVDTAAKLIRTTKKKIPASKGKSKTKATIKPKVAAKKEYQLLY